MDSVEMFRTMILILVSLVAMRTCWIIVILILWIRKPLPLGRLAQHAEYAFQPENNNASIKGRLPSPCACMFKWWIKLCFNEFHEMLIVDSRRIIKKHTSHRAYAAHVHATRGSFLRVVDLPKTYRFLNHPLCYVHTVIWYDFSYRWKFCVWQGRNIFQTFTLWTKWFES